MVCQTSACIFSKLPYPVKRFERQCQPHGNGREFCMQRTPRPIAENQGVRLLSIIIFFKGGTTTLAVPFQFLWWYLQISGTRRKSEVHRRHFQFKVKQNIATLDFSQSFLIHFPSPTCQELQAHTHLATWIGRLAPPARGGAPGDSDVSIYGWIKPILPCLGSWTCTYIQYT